MEAVQWGRQVCDVRMGYGGYRRSGQVDNPQDPEGTPSILPRMAASRTRWWKGTGDLGRMPPRMGVRPEGTRPGRLRYGAAANEWMVVHVRRVVPRGGNGW